VTTWVLLRGLARESRHWGDFPQRLQQALPAGDTVLAPDLPGNGARWRDRSPASVAGLHDAVRADLARRHVAGPYVVVALSLGGMVAMHWAACAPGELEGCVLVNSSARGHGRPWQRLQPRAWLPLLAWLLPGGDLPRRERRIWRLTSTRPLDDDVLAQWVSHAGSAPVSRGNVARQLLAAWRFRPPHRVQVPTLVLSSMGDRLVSPHCSASLATAWQAPLHAHAEAGHDLPLDAPQWVVQQILRWRAAR
jgi:pimeloyl-ACP methyl ester carboxylesterase